ncbi:MAG: sensor histidine kinase [Candidatus Dormibacteria bacterium]
MRAAAKSVPEPADPSLPPLPPSREHAALIEAGILLASDLSLPTVLQRLVELAARFTDARYGALGVLGPNGTITDFLTVGLDRAQRDSIGDPPQGKGVLGLLVSDPRPLRLERIGDHPSSVGFPKHHPLMTTFIGTPIRAKGKVFGNLYLTDKRGGMPFQEPDEELLATLAGQAGVAIANAQNHEDLQQRERWLKALHQTTSAILSRGSVDSLLAAIVRVAREISKSDLAAVVLPHQPGSARLRVVAVDGRGSHRLEHLELPRSGTASHAVMRSGRPRLVESGSAQISWFAKAGVEVGAVMVVPLTVQERVEGTILIARPPTGPPFRPDDMNLLDSFAVQAALALDYLRIQEELQRLAVLEERHRIARDLHDEPVQALIYLSRRLERLAAEPELTGPAASQLAEIRNLAIAVADGLRQLTEGLRSETLDELGLGPALAELGERFAQRADVDVSVRIEGAQRRWPEAVERGFLRIAQEALSNVERHSNAAHLVLTLNDRSSRLRLVISDDGIGFPAVPGRPSHDGLGMLGMRERATLLGGRLRVRSQPGRGTLVLARVVAPEPAPGDS